MAHKSLRHRVARLAHHEPELRPYLLPILRRGARDLRRSPEAKALASLLDPYESFLVGDSLVRRLDEVLRARSGREVRDGLADLKTQFDFFSGNVPKPNRDKIYKAFQALMGRVAGQ